MSVRDPWFAPRGSTPTSRLRSLFDVISGEDFALNGCVCQPDAACFLHGRMIPQGVQDLETLARAANSQERPA